MFEVLTNYGGLIKGDVVPVLDKGPDWVKVQYRGALYVPRNIGYIRAEQPQRSRPSGLFFR